MSYSKKKAFWVEVELTLPDTGPPLQPQPQPTPHLLLTEEIHMILHFRVHGPPLGRPSAALHPDPLPNGSTYLREYSPAKRPSPKKKGILFSVVTGREPRVWHAHPPGCEP